ncbi:MAG: NADH-quinone oxidoreductase subunit J [Gammaproteobacteria bacterium]
MAPKILFYLFSIVLVLASLRVITARNPVHSALSLVLAFFSSACLWMLLQAEFLAIVLVLVYVGAVMVLFLFVVMMLDINLEPLREGFIRYLPVGVVVAVLIVAQLAAVLGFGGFEVDDGTGLSQAGTPGVSNTEALGLKLYTEYVFAFEVAAVVLLVAIVAAIALTMRRREGVRGQQPENQVAVRRADRVRLVNLHSEDRQ